jgi:transcriptional regulator with XRE-family HTH domain
MSHINISDIIRQMLADSGVTQTELAHRMGTSYAGANYLFDPSTNLSLRSVKRVADALGYELIVEFRPARTPRGRHDR